MTRSIAPPTEKYRAIITLIEDCKTRGQPVLVGTTSIEKSEQLAEMLRKQGWEQHDFTDPNAFAALYSGDEGATRAKVFAILNARYHEQEAYIVAQAGVPGAITIATNMAGRGTDIQLGGNADMRVRQELADVADGEERERRIAEIRGQVARLKEKALGAGGLFVLGTERHELRRIDNQLRGRSGRQGDPGHSKFFLSLQDDLMRIFGSDKLDGMLQKLGLQENEAIVHPWINKALEKAQQKVEARNFDLRKNVLKFDNVMNDQRKVIFDQRIELMKDENVADTIADMRKEVVDALVAKHVPENAYPEQWNTKGLKEELDARARPRPAGRRMGERGRHCRRGTDRAGRAPCRRAHGGQGGAVGTRRHALRREVDPAADPRPTVARASRSCSNICARSSGCAASASAIRSTNTSRKRFSCSRRWSSTCAKPSPAQLMRVEIMQAPPPEPPAESLPYMEAHHINPATGEDEMAMSDAVVTLARNAGAATSSASMRNPKDPTQLGARSAATKCAPAAQARSSSTATGALPEVRPIPSRIGSHPEFTIAVDHRFDFGVILSERPALFSGSQFCSDAVSRHRASNILAAP